jgi:hypothetical protein
MMDGAGNGADDIRSAYEASVEFRAWKRDLVGVTALRALFRLAEIDNKAALEAAAGFLEEAGAGTPELSALSEDVRGDAAFWADVASPVELEAYVAGGLRRMGTTAFATETRKRLFVALWQSMPDAEKRAFLSRVDPKGVFRGKAR